MTMKSTPQSSDGDKSADPHAPKDPHSLQETAAPLPHENGKQAHSDVERGLKDTDRRGGGEYQEKTQNDAHADINSDGKASGSKSEEG